MMAFDAIAFAAHPDDLEVTMGGTAMKLVAAGLRVLFVDLTDREQAFKAAALLGVERLVLCERDRLLQDSVSLRLSIAQLIRAHCPRLVFATEGHGVHPDHRALTDIVVNGVFYARLPSWERVEGGVALAGTEPHEFDRLFFARCRMERPAAV